MTRILLDEGVPRPLARELMNQGLETVYFPNAWKQLPDGDLLRRAVSDGFDVLITNDRNMPYQQSLDDLDIAVLVLPSNHLPLVRHLAPAIGAAAGQLQSGTFVFLSRDGAVGDFEHSTRKP